LKVIKNPITDHLPSNSLKVGTSCKAEVIKSEEYFRKRAKNGPVMFML
jgi:rRNA small subunit pseudouridine methyltransferase Nep1